MNQLPYDAVIFDLDGTLCNAEQGIVSSALYALEQLGHSLPQGADPRGIIGPPLVHGFERVLGLPAELIPRATELYCQHFDREGMYKYTVYPHIRSILRMLREEGAYLAVATSKSEKPCRAVLDHFALTHYFDRIITADSNHSVASKVELVRRALPERYERAAMVGDRCFDMEAARANGIEGIGAGYGFGSDQELRDAGAEHIVPDTEALRALLCQGAEIPRGFFLTVEGLDGSGKTTQVDLLEKSLRAYGFSVLRTREPGGCPISEDIRQIILDTKNMEMSPACEALLYAAARAQHVAQVIRPAVETGMLVLCDRFVDSSIAYQGGGRELGLESVQQINAPAVGDMMPDATLYLEIDFRVGLQRRLGASAPDRLELEAFDFHERVQKTYERLLHDNRKRFMVVDAGQEPEAVAEDALALVLARLEREE
ncbi:MAG: dTMP kinase [Candidatus Limiplasma sp.]|nr:dTMP kinase [Candidatus Limiplasma sp.]